MNEWAQALEDELSEQYNVPANALGKHVRYVEVELPGTRHSLDVRLHNLYGFIVTLNVGDETGGLLIERDIYIGVRQSDLADTIHSFYSSY